MKGLEIQCPILVNWDGRLFVAGSEFFADWGVKFEGNMSISYPQSARGNKQLCWILTRDARLLKFHEVAIKHQWARPLRWVARITRIVGDLDVTDSLTVAMVRKLLAGVKTDHPEFNNRRDLLRVIKDRSGDEAMTVRDMEAFLLISASEPEQKWP